MALPLFNVYSNVDLFFHLDSRSVVRDYMKSSVYHVGCDLSKKMGPALHSAVTYLNLGTGIFSCKHLEVPVK